MEKRIRRLGIFMVLCFVALFLQLNNIQVLKADSLSTDPQNPRVIAVARSQPRGEIISADGVTLARSVVASSGAYKYQRQYNPDTATLFSQIVGYDSPIYGNLNGIEAQYNGNLVSHTRPARSLQDLLVNRTTTDNVQLTVGTKLQGEVAAAVNGANVNGSAPVAAAVVLNPTTGAVDAMYANPSFDPNPLVSPDTATEKQAWDSDLAAPGNPLRAGAYNQLYPPGSSFKVITTSAVLEHRPDLAAMTFPTVASIDLPDTGTPPQKLTNYHSELCGGTLQQLLIQSCDADFASIGQQLGAPLLVNQAQAYGFNQTIPIDLPPSTVAVSNFPTADKFATDIPGLMKSAIGQEDVTASALQMAVVAGGVANGGVIMTPHLMAQIRDSQGDLVTSYSPKPWMKAVSAQTAQTLTTFMQGVVSDPSGTAAGVGFPTAWDVAAKTGTAEVAQNLTTDWMIAFAPASHPTVAVAVVVPNQAPSATGAAVSGPVMKQILQDVLGSGS